MRPLVLVFLATPALAEIPAIADGEEVVACYEDCGCLAIDPATGKVTGKRTALPTTFGVNDDEPSVKPALARCGKKCAVLGKTLAEDATRTVAVDPTGKLLFEVEPDGYPTHGRTWSLVTGKQVTRFRMDEFDGPPPPVTFDHAEFVGRHVFVGEPDADFTLVFDIFTGAMDLLFEHAKLGHGLVVENDGFGRLDLVDFAQPGHPRVAVRRIRASRQDAPTVQMRVVPIGAKALVLVEEPRVTLVVDPRRRTISKPRALPACSTP